MTWEGFAWGAKVVSVDGHLACFQVLAIVNSAARNNGVRVTF